MTELAPARACPRPLVGRRAELEMLGDGLRSARDGRTAVFLVGGEAGVGKSRLVEAFAAAAGREGFRVLVGHCTTFSEATLPYVPMLDVIRSLLHDLGPAALDELVHGRVAELGCLMPELARRPDERREPADDSARARLFEVMLALLARLAEQSPLVLVLEDVHAADASTRDLLAYLVRRLTRVPLVVVLTYRSDELGPRHPLRALLADIEPACDARRLEVRRFHRRELIAQLTASLPTAPSPDLVDLVWERSEGNPFFAEELAAAIRHDERGLPATLEGILRCRLESLSPAAQRVLRVVSAGGRSVGHELLATVADLPPAELVEALREAVANHVLVVDQDTNAYAFRHALLREAAYAEFLPVERTALHAAYAGVLTERPQLGGGPGAVAGDLAHHWYASQNQGRALVAAVEAGTLAEEQFGFVEAEAYFERALELWDKVPDPHGSVGFDRPALLERTARVAALAGNHRRASALLGLAIAEAETGGDRVRAGLLLERRGRCLWSAGDSEAALVAYEDALARIPTEPPTTARARVLAAQAESLFLLARHGDAVPRAEETIAIARAVGATSEESRARRALGAALAYLGRAEDGVVELRRALAMAEEVGDPEAVVLAHLSLAEVLSGPLDRVDEAAEIAVAGVARARSLGLERDYGVSLHAIAANMLFRLGRWDEAQDLLAEALERNPTGAAAIGLYLARGKLSVGRGEFDAAEDDLRTARELSRAALDPRWHVPLCTLTAGLALWRGRLDEARRAVSEGLARLAGSDDEWLLVPLVWHGLRAEADRAERARAGRHDREANEALDVAGAFLARLHSSKLASTATPPGGPMAVAYQRLCDGEWSRVVGRPDAAVWDVAARALEDLSQPYPAAYARARQAEALIGAGESKAAGPVLRAAHATAMRLGAAPFRRAIEQLAARARISLADDQARRSADAPTSPLHQLGLTPREAEVLRLVAEGRTNRQIAETLFISEKTASVHVSNILAKLSVTRRAEAAAVAHRLGLLTPA